MSARRIKVGQNTKKGTLLFFDYDLNMGVPFDPERLMFVLGFAVTDTNEGEVVDLSSNGKLLVNYDDWKTGMVGNV